VVKYNFKILEEYYSEVAINVCFFENILKKTRFLNLRVFCEMSQAFTIVFSNLTSEVANK